MFILRMLGGLSLDGPRVPARAAQRRRLALLARLAATPGASVPRDKLLGLLWPDVPQEDARHRLATALTDLRKALGEDAFISRGDEVGVAPGVLTTDVARFESAIEARDWEEAVFLYAGPFLDGVYVNGAPEFDHWVDSRRDALERAHLHALRGAAGARAASGDDVGALDAWRRVVASDPWSGANAVGYMRALDAAGDRVGALRHAQTHARLLREEFEAEPDPDVEALAAELRATRGTPRRRVAAPPPAPTVRFEHRRSSWPALAAAAVGVALFINALR